MLQWIDDIDDVGEGKTVVAEQRIAVIAFRPVRAGVF
jgi:hypothetical protein